MTDLKKEEKRSEGRFLTIFFEVHKNVESIYIWHPLDMDMTADGAQRF